MGRKCTSGLTIIELLVAMAAAGIIAIGVARLWTGFVQQSARQKKIQELQSQILTASQLIESDARMAGFGLPGNGIYPAQTIDGRDSITIFINRDNVQTTLTGNVSAGSTSLQVAGVTGIRTGQWLCLSSDTVVYRRIISVETATGTIGLGAPLPRFFGSAATRVAVAQRISYTIDPSAPAFVRWDNDRRSDLGPLLDTLGIIARDNSQNILSSNYHLARSISITLGGTASAFPIRQTVETNIRNFQ